MTLSMNRITRKLAQGLLLAIFFVCQFTVSFSQTFDDPSSLYEVAASIKAQNFAERSHYELTDLSTVISDVSAVQSLPCKIEFARTVLTPSPRLIGVERALNTVVVPEEDCDRAALVVAPLFKNGTEYSSENTDHSSIVKYLKWMNYIDGTTATAGSETFRQALVFRKQGRVIKLNLFCEKEVGQGFFALSQANFTLLKENQTFKWLVEDIFEPVTIVLEPVMKQRMGQQVVSQGLSFFRYTVLTFSSHNENNTVMFEAGKPLLHRSDSCLFVGDIKNVLTVDEAIDNDSLGNILGHECFHGIMFDMMGSKAAGKKFSVSMVGHDAHVVSDYSLALSEGWAECYEALSGQSNPAFDDSEAMTRFLVGRQDAVRSNRYIQAGYEKYEHTKRTGIIKNGSQLISNEGFVAATLYQLLNHRAIDNGFNLALAAMYLKTPTNICEMVHAMASLAEDKRTSDIILKVFLFGSRFATVSSEAKSLYQEYYQGRLAWLNGKNSQLTTDEIDNLKSWSKEASHRYHSFVKSLLPQVLTGEFALDSAVGPEIWLELTNDGKIINKKNLNTATFVDLISLGLTEKGAFSVISLRESLGFVTMLSDLKTLNSSDFELLSSLLLKNKN